ncbi:chymotrypsin-1-like [Melanaphis sacchari]|uniref:chymotrypsin-1-like n=1 Tax=Melanaphis sacchari TaxID=742174 RepID=UPI000DC1572D|nr:chymotrypsin-1-like [Melanaphis sacchari]
MRIALILLLIIEIAKFEVNVTKHNIYRGLIYNGRSYSEDDYPFVISIKIKYPNHTKKTCSGSLLKKLFVLTSVHCVYGIDIDYIEVYQGTWLQNNISRNLVEMYIHEDYNPDNKHTFISGDISVLKINKPFPKIKKYIKIGGTHRDFTNGKILNCTVIGFGLINENTMGTKGFMSNIMVKHGKKACRGSESNPIKNTWQQYLCMIPGENTTCDGDNGGPMICNGLLYGICSFAINYNGEMENICGSENLQTVHVFLYYYRKWINNIIKSDIPTTVSIPDTATIIPDTTDLPDTLKTPKYTTKKPLKPKKNVGKSITPHILYTILTLLFYHGFSSI